MSAGKGRAFCQCVVSVPFVGKGWFGFGLGGKESIRFFFPVMVCEVGLCGGWWVLELMASEDVTGR